MVLALSDVGIHMDILVVLVELSMTHTLSYLEIAFIMGQIVGQIQDGG